MRYNFKGGILIRLKFFGFTLAEVLVTLGVIGVVAAMTIPSLFTRIEEKVLINKLLEVNSQLVEASKLMVNEYGLVNTYSDDEVERRDLFFEYLSRHLKLSECTWKSCMSQPYVAAYNNPRVWRFYNDSFYLPNGALIFYTATFNEPCNVSKDSSRGIGSCGFFFVDVNGRQKPNTFGIDTFKFQVYPDGIVAAGGPKYNYWANAFYECLRGGADYRQSACCTGWVIKNKNMDYRRCQDLSWTGKSKCTK